MAIWVEAKDPAETVGYPIFWGPHLAGDEIVASSWSVQDGGVTIDAQAYTTDTTYVRISGGALGSKVVLTNTIQTLAGLVLRRSLALRVVGK